MFSIDVKESVVVFVGCDGYNEVWGDEVAIYYKDECEGECGVVSCECVRCC